MWVQKGGVIVANPYKNSDWLKIRLSPIHSRMLNEICEDVNINKSEFIRFAIAYWHCHRVELLNDDSDIIDIYLHSYIDEFHKQSNFSELAKPLIDRLNNGDQSALDEFIELAKKQSGK